MIQAQRGTGSILIAPQTATNSATLAGTVDTRGAAYATIDIALASEINTNAVGPSLSLLEDETTVATNFATFDSNFTRASEDITAARLVRYHVDLRGRKRYLRLTVSSATTTNDNIGCAAVCTLTRKGDGPASTSDMATVAVIG